MLPGSFEQRPNVAAHKAWQSGLNLLRRPVPPADAPQRLDRFRRESPLDRLGGNAADDGIRLDVPGDDRPRADDCAVANGHALQNHRFVADPYVVANHDVALVVPSRGDVRPVQSPMICKDRERIGGKRAHRVVRAGEEELRPAGDGAVLANDQPLLVDRVVIEHVVCLKLRGVAHKIVVERKVANKDARVRDHVFEVVVLRQDNGQVKRTAKQQWDTLYERSRFDWFA